MGAIGAAGAGYGMTVQHTADLDRRLGAWRTSSSKQDRADDSLHDLSMAQAEIRTELRLMRETVGDIDDNVDTLLSRVEGAR